MPKLLTIKLAPGERVIAISPEYHGGPGWSNTPIWVHIVSDENKYRHECIQPKEQTAEQHLLFRMCAEAHRQMLATITTKRSKA